MGEVGAPGPRPWGPLSLCPRNRAQGGSQGRTWERPRIPAPSPQPLAGPFPRFSPQAPIRARHYLQPPLPSRAARPSPHPPAARPPGPGCGSGSPSSRPSRSCLSPADYTSRRPPRPRYVTLAPAFPPESGPELRLPASSAAALGPRPPPEVRVELPAAARFGAGGGCRGCAPFSAPGRPGARRARRGVSGSRRPDRRRRPGPRCGPTPMGQGEAAAPGGPARR